ncbi:MAG TPA: lysophospholipid acyltransferase family protein [Clostridia bacterium]|nr:lysophospholipid acyltransferase family protein [Clostridia bacterium]
MQWFFKLARAVVGFLMPLAFHIQYEGVHNIPQNGKGYILACNHTSYLDPVLLALRIKPWVRYMAKEELMRISGLKWLFRWLGIIPVSRGAGDLSVISHCAELTREGYVLGIFPEGTRFPAGQPGKPKSGMALIAKMTQADVLPCAVTYERPLHFRSRIGVCFGEVIPYAALGLDENSPRALKRATKCIWEEILTLLGLGVEKDEG